jgi:DnaJ-domain-containing protein 1
MAKQSYYDLLGVSERATEAEIKASYRKLAQRYHPDVNKEPSAEEKFTTINVAYSVLSDSLKRADYDQELAQTVVRRPAADDTRASSYAAEHSRGRAEEAVSAEPTRAQYFAAFTRVFFSSAAGLIIGGVLQYIASADLDSLNAASFVWGPLAGLVVGAIWGADVNFRIETFLVKPRLVRAVSFFRTAGLGIGLGYGGALLGVILAHSIHRDPQGFVSAGLILGVLSGATYGSDGEGWQKLTAGHARFELFYAGIRAGSVGVIAGILGLLLGGTLEIFGAAGVAGWTALVAGLLGFILGAISPSNLSAYASYVSASVRSTLFILAVALALLIGLIWGSLYGPQTFQAIASIFHR